MGGRRHDPGRVPGQEIRTLGSMSGARNRGLGIGREARRLLSIASREPSSRQGQRTFSTVASTDCGDHVIDTGLGASGSASSLY